jgi:hypothetical protein
MKARPCHSSGGLLPTFQCGSQPGFNAKSVNVGFVVNKEALDQVLFK